MQAFPLPVSKARMPHRHYHEVEGRDPAHCGATAEYFPAYACELQAYAAAVGVALLDLWTMSVAGEPDGDGFEGCTTVVVNGGRSIGHNEDWDRDSSEDVCILRKKCGDATRSRAGPSI